MQHHITKQALVNQYFLQFLNTLNQVCIDHYKFITLCKVFDGEKRSLKLLQLYKSFVGYKNTHLQQSIGFALNGILYIHVNLTI